MDCQYPNMSTTWMKKRLADLDSFVVDFTRIVDVCAYLIDEKYRLQAQCSELREKCKVKEEIGAVDIVQAAELTEENERLKKDLQQSQSETCELRKLLEISQCSHNVESGSGSISNIDNDDSTAFMTTYPDPVSGIVSPVKHNNLPPLRNEVLPAVALLNASGTGPSGSTVNNAKKKRSSRNKQPKINSTTTALRIRTSCGPRSLSARSRTAVALAAKAEKVNKYKQQQQQLTKSSVVFSSENSVKNMKKASLESTKSSTIPRRRSNGHFNCGHCAKSFLTRQLLCEHIWKHEGVWPLTCKFCSKGFRRPSVLQKHEHQHKQQEQLLQQHRQQENHVPGSMDSLSQPQAAHQYSCSVSLKRDHIRMRISNGFTSDTNTSTSTPACQNDDLDVLSAAQSLCEIAGNSSSSSSDNTLIAQQPNNNSFAEPSVGNLVISIDEDDYPEEKPIPTLPFPRLHVPTLHVVPSLQGSQSDGKLLSVESQHMKENSNVNANGINTSDQNNSEDEADPVMCDSCGEVYFPFNGINQHKCVQNNSNVLKNLQ